MSMTIQQVRREKEHLELKIEELVTAFNKATRAKVEAIVLEYFNDGSSLVIVKIIIP